MINNLRQRLIKFLIGRDMIVMANLSIPIPLYLSPEDIPKNGGLIMNIYCGRSVQLVRTQWESEKLEMQG